MIKDVEKTLGAIYDVLPEDAAAWACEYLFDELLRDVAYGYADDAETAAYIYNEVQYIDYGDVEEAYKEAFCDIFEDVAFDGAIGILL